MKKKLCLGSLGIYKNKLLKNHTGLWRYSRVTLLKHTVATYRPRYLLLLFTSEISMRELIKKEFYRVKLISAFILDTKFIHLYAHKLLSNLSALQGEHWKQRW